MYSYEHNKNLKNLLGESPSWLRHRILIPAFQGSNPCSPANNIFSFLSQIKSIKT